MRRRARGLAIAAGIVLGGSIGVLTAALAGAPAAGATQAVSIVNTAYAPATLTVTAGTQVTWTNNETNGTSHSVTSDTAGLFDSSPSCSPSSTGGCVMPGQTFSFTFASAGTFAYHCHVHSFMHGTIVVTAATTPTPTATATPTPTAPATSTPTSSPTPSSSPLPASTVSPTPSLTSPAATGPGPSPGTQVLGTSTSRPTIPVTGARDAGRLLATAAVLLVAGVSLVLAARQARTRSGG